MALFSLPKIQKRNYNIIQSYFVLVVRFLLLFSLILDINKHAAMSMMISNRKYYLYLAEGYLDTWLRVELKKDLNYAKVVEISQTEKVVTKIYLNVFIKIILLETNVKKKVNQKKNKQISLHTQTINTHMVFTHARMVCANICS